ncbi:hypothetical protein HELRODRAFT_172939 [Helobdella robusta]|uniref:Apple domain-containing protein n=1 Tax=Helobdella robusta TaxID=6412 RepID=T1F662_HELRO|nr:hypothetical protein HELRODRAFT_172939 [Helobdella robusta]ESO03911.1 hypothetical protein HELRODRAFT_172939 [Helobdella robusta]
MNYFIVGLKDNNQNIIRGNYLVCGQYPKKAEISKKHTLKCNPFLPKQQFLIVQQYLYGGGGFTICQLEIYLYEALSNVSSTVWTKQYMDEPTKTYSVLLLGNVLHETRRRSLLDCVVLCSVEASRQCDSLNYCKWSNLCQLNSHKYGYQRSSIQIVNDDTYIISRWIDTSQINDTFSINHIHRHREDQTNAHINKINMKQHCMYSYSVAKCLYSGRPMGVEGLLTLPL